jgi:hypothetical protein
MAPKTTETVRASTKKATRSLRFYEGAPALLEITSGKLMVGYWLSVIPSDFGVGFQLKKCAGDGAETYHVNVSHDHLSDSCDCIGHERHRHCKHSDAVRVLIQQGKLPAPPAPPASDFVAEFCDP